MEAQRLTSYHVAEQRLMSSALNTKQHKRTNQVWKCVHVIDIDVKDSIKINES